MPPKGNWLPFEEARAYVHSLGLISQDQWGSWSKSGNRPPNIPGNPDTAYKNHGWINFGDWLGTGRLGTINRTFRSFEEARDYVRSLGFRTRNEWKAWSKSGNRPGNIPSNPNGVYKNQGWSGFADWLGTSFMPFEQAREYVRSLNLNGQDTWRRWCASGVRPPNIPAAPDRIYKNHGWAGFGDWLGTGNLRNTKGSYLPFEQAREYVRSLKLEGYESWCMWRKSSDRPVNIPASPNTTYENQGWAGYGDWLGTGTLAPKDREYMPFAQARDYVHGLKLSSRAAWKQWSASGERPTEIPANPWHVYRNQGWAGSGDWLGTGFVANRDRSYLPFERAREYVRALKFEDQNVWRKWSASGDRPLNIPAAPGRIYKSKGWLGMDDWLREGAVQSPRMWKVSTLRRFVASLSGHLDALTPAELYLLFQQNGLLTTRGPGRPFARAVVSGTIPPAEIQKFANGEPSQVDQFIATTEDDTPEDESSDVASDERASEAKRAELPVAGAPDIDQEPTLDPDVDLTNVVVDGGAEATHDLPLVETASALAALDRVVSSADAEAVEFLIASAVRKMWSHAFRDEAQAVVQAQQAAASEYAHRAVRQFLNEYHTAKHLSIPNGYAFRDLTGRPSEPHLMQRLVASLVVNRRRVGNWSGTGAGKTLAAVLASRGVDAGLTVVCCPNSVVDVWRSTVCNAFPDSQVAIKSWDALEQSATTGFEDRRHRYLILNYEMFQQPDSAQRVRRLLEREHIDMLVIDEVQGVKQREVMLMSRRRANVAMLVSQAGLLNPDLYVLGMSATPVVNNLQEGKSLVELITGIEHPELETRATIDNCMKLHQRLVTLGIREQPNYEMGLTTVVEPVDVSDALPAIRTVGSSLLDLERILTRARLPVIRQHVKKGTLIYTDLLDGIEKQLRDAVLDAGFSVGSFTGEDKSGLAAFLRGDIDVLIGSSAIGTGVDGLQQVCDTVIMNVLPWTAAQYDQIKGRAYRQGQARDVTVVLPLTFAMVNGERWSWCESKMRRLEFKRSIADAAVDGVVPIGHLRSPQQALKDQLGWLKRLETGEVESITRPRLVIPLPPADKHEDERRRMRHGEFALMNNRINATHSAATHERMQANPEEWAEYHSRYRQQRQDWPLVPFEDMVRYYAEDEGLVIGDFGCGEAQIAKALADRHTVHSFDHVAISDVVQACDIAHTPLESGSLDAAIFCLSLMGSNFGDYLREAARVLKRDRVLHIYEATTRFGLTETEVSANRQSFARCLRDFGFDVVDVSDRWKFTYIKAIRSQRAPVADAPISFRPGITTQIIRSESEATSAV